MQKIQKAVAFLALIINVKYNTAAANNNDKSQQRWQTAGNIIPLQVYEFSKTDVLPGCFRQYV